MAYRSFSCLQTGIRINSCCLSMGSMLKPEAPRFFSSFRRFTAAVQNGRIGSKIRKMNRPSVIRARGHMVSLYPYRHTLPRITRFEGFPFPLCRKDVFPWPDSSSGAGWQAGPPSAGCSKSQTGPFPLRKEKWKAKNATAARKAPMSENRFRHGRLFCYLRF